MSGKLGALASKHSHGEQDFELNIASIIDCFTVLITYLLVSASFITIGVLDVNVAPSSPSVTLPSEASKAPLTIFVNLRATKGIQLRVDGASEPLIAFPPKDGDWDFTSLSDQILGLKQKYPELASATLNAADDIEYREVVKAVETIRKNVPAVTMGDEPVN